jgi:hypothetical protein
MNTPNEREPETGIADNIRKAITLQNVAIAVITIAVVVAVLVIFGIIPV